MFKYTIQIYENNTWTALSGWVRPFTDGRVLDETLDSGMINLKDTSRSTKIRPFTRLRIFIYESTDNGTTWTYKGKIQRVVTDTKITRKRMIGTSVVYDWSISTVEVTKLLEREKLSSMTVTKYLSKTYTEGFTYVTPKEEYVGQHAITASSTVYTTPHVPGAFSIYGAGSVLTISSGWAISTGNIYVKDADNETLATINWLDGGSYTFTDTGTYKIVYDCQYMGIGMTTIYYYTATYTLGIFQNSTTVLTNKSITDVVKRLLSAGVTRRYGQTFNGTKATPTKYTFNSTQATKYSSIESPEFSFGECTLFEALLQIGYKINSIPRLQVVNETENSDDILLEVYFENIGGYTSVPTSSSIKMVYEDRSFSSSDYVGTIDSPAQNFINTEDYNKGAITELGNDYITVRAEEGSIEISADTALIRTSLPIYKIIKVECGYFNGSVVGDITPYVYESGEYNTLSSYDGAYPFTKKYAIYYTQGTNEIKGFSFKATASTTLATTLGNYAIVNIIHAKGYSTYSATDILNTAFKVTYVPIVSTRVQQRKSHNTDGVDFDNVITYNQGGSQVETSAYGEKMRGAIARLGLQAIQRTYDYFTYAQIPSPGQVMTIDSEKYYVSAVDTQYDRYKIRATLTLTKNFNMLSQYVGLDSQWRLYDVSEKQSVDRNIVYGENIYIGNSPGGGYTYAMIEGALGQYQTLTQMLQATLVRSSNYTNTKIDMVVAKPFKVSNPGTNSETVSQENLTKCILPVVSFGLGNSLVFSFTYMNNYGAGYQSTDQFQDGSEYKRVQREVPYANTVGEIGGLKLEYRTQGWSPTSSEQESGGKANLYPEYDGSTLLGGIQLTTQNRVLIIQKDSKEKLAVVVQEHFVGNRDSIVIGSALSSKNSLVADVNGDGNTAKLYWFRHRLNELDGIVDLTGAIEGTFTESNIVQDQNYNCSKITGLTNPSNIYRTDAWGLVDTQTNRLYIGENVTVESLETAPDVWFYSKQN